MGVQGWSRVVPGLGRVGGCPGLVQAWAGLVGVQSCSRVVGCWQGWWVSRVAAGLVGVQGCVQGCQCLAEPIDKSLVLPIFLLFLRVEMHINGKLAIISEAGLPGNNGAV
jgi:hypothetical protein